MYFINIFGRIIKQAMVPPLSLLDKRIIKLIKYDINMIKNIEGNFLHACLLH